MKKTFVPLTITAVVAALALGAVRTSMAADEKPADKPSACVVCHTKTADGDHSMSAIIAGMVKGVDAKLLAKAQAAAPEGATLKGKHMNVASMVKSVPDGCVKCHNDKSKMAPPMGRMLHMIHLTGEDNHFAKLGTCTSCHSLDEKTGVQSITNGPSN